MGRLNGKGAFVLGGASGIGLAIASRFAAEGAEVFLTGRRDLEKSLATVGSNAHGIQADASDPASIARAFDEVRAKCDRLDVLVVNAGMSEYGKLGEIVPEHFDKIFALNVRAWVFAVQSALPLLRDGGSIVLIGSVAGARGVAGYGVYAASKAAVRSFAQTWTLELAPRRIRVNLVSPGPTDTEMMAATTDEVRKALTGMIPFGRMALPDEVADAALFLASDESRYIAGAEIAVDGGMSQV